MSESWFIRLEQFSNKRFKEDNIMLCERAVQGGFFFTGYDTEGTYDIHTNEGVDYSGLGLTDEVVEQLKGLVREDVTVGNTAVPAVMAYLEMFCDCADDLELEGEGPEIGQDHVGCVDVMTGALVILKEEELKKMTRDDEKAKELAGKLVFISCEQSDTPYYSMFDKVDVIELFSSRNNRPCMVDTIYNLEDKEQLLINVDDETAVRSGRVHMMKVSGHALTMLKIKDAKD